MPTAHIAGYDGSDASAAALRFASVLAGAAGEKVIAATVYRVGVRAFKGAADGTPSALDAQSRADAERVLDEVGPDVTRRVVGAGSPAEGLLWLAEDEPAALLAVGVTHRRALGRLVPGSVAEHLLHGAPCPIAVVPADFTRGPVRTVAVAYDAGDESAVALRVGEELARRLGARLIIITVSEAGLSSPAVPREPFLSGGRLANREPLERQHVQRVLDALPPGLHVDLRVLRGSAASTLVGACQDDVDLLVVGSRGYGPARSVLLGSVSRYVVDHAPCPVIAVPRAASVHEPAGPAAVEA